VSRALPLTEAEPTDSGGASATLAKGLSVLAAYAASENSVTNADIAERVGLPRPTVARLTNTLIQSGYLVRVSRGRVQVAAGALTLGYPVLTRLVDRQLARPLMRDFAERLGGAVSIATVNQLDYVFVESVQIGNSMAHTPEVGFSAPLAATAIGRALLAAMSCAALEQYRQTMLRERPEEWQQFGEAAMAGVDECRRQGFCSIRGTWRPQHFGVASMLGRTSRGEVLAINCGMPSWRMTDQQFEDAQLGRRIVALAADIRAVMGLSAISEV
jgi:DNA-binding IclR family transcriptional regulator